MMAVFSRSGGGGIVLAAGPWCWHWLYPRFGPSLFWTRELQGSLGAAGDDTLKRITACLRPESGTEVTMIFGTPIPPHTHAHPVNPLPAPNPLPLPHVAAH